MMAAGAVAGKNKGLAKLVSDKNSLALYTHCYSHHLNLGVQKTCSIMLVRDMLAEVGEISLLFFLTFLREGKCF